MSSAAVISNLARSFLAGEQTADAIRTRAARTLGRPWRWLEPLTQRYIEAFGNGTRPRLRDVVRFLLNDQDFARARAKYHRQIGIAEWLPDAQRMQPVEAAAQWGLPAIATAGALADWLCLSAGELEWLADLKGLGAKLSNPKLHHYHYCLLQKRSGGVRLTERPKTRLKEAQRRILSEILDRVPAHPAVHGFIKGRSIVTFASPHADKQVVLRLDLQDFFPAFPAARVQALFRTLGYPEHVANLLGGIATNAVPSQFWNPRAPEIDTKSWQEARILYSRPHLPQGAPTSPALANLMAYRLDCRLSGLAKAAGADYTRYADDLAFSGNEQFARVVQRFSLHAAAIAMEEGFSVNHHKTRVMRRGVRQQLAGVIVNRHVSLRRRELELLEAILSNCVRHGPESQNREQLPDFRAHLDGRIGYVQMVNGVKGQRLRTLFQKIRWPS